jgi:hypothetical protein
MNLSDFNFTLLVWLVLLTFVTFRIGWMLARDDGPFAIFDTWRKGLEARAGESKVTGWAWTISELFHCPICLGIWISAILLIFVPLPFFTKVILWLAVSGLQSFLTLLIIKDE